MARRRTLRLLGGVLFAAVLVLLGHAGHVVLGGNFHEVVRGEVYRSAQLSPATLEAYIRARGIRTVINLRGENFDDDWYYNEKAACARAGAVFEDVGLWAYQPSPQGELVRLVDFLEHAQTPILVHCHTGADRAGLASVFALLLRTDTPLAQARGQLTLYFGHMRWGKAACHDRLLDHYERWLREVDKPHCAEMLRHWVRYVYRPEMVLR
jgi:protein tyrosine/serine phosphatase